MTRAGESTFKKEVLPPRPSPTSSVDPHVFLHIVEQRRRRDAVTTVVGTIWALLIVIGIVLAFFGFVELLTSSCGDF